MVAFTHRKEITEMKNGIAGIFFFFFCLMVWAFPGAARAVGTPPLDEVPSENIEHPQPPVAGNIPSLTAYHGNETALRAVEKNVTLFSERIKSRFSLWLARSGKYLELMQDILRQKDVPEDFVFLSLIESGFNPNAYSIARAVGPWQFIASTGKRYGLEIDWWRDERKDPVKSTEAAAAYLKDLHKMFGSWNLAMAAYNAGEGRILRALKKSNSDTYWELLHTDHIKTETKEYVPRFIAASLIANRPEDFGFDKIEYHAPLSFDVVEIDSPVDLAVAAECAGTTAEEVRKLNPELRRWSTPPDVKVYPLRIPEGTREIFLENLSSIPKNERFTIERYTVSKGDTFSRISKKTGVPIHVILSLNSIERIKPVKPGSTLYLPPMHLFALDHDDKTALKKASYTGSRKAAPKLSKKASLKTKKKAVTRKGAKAKKARRI